MRTKLKKKHHKTRLKDKLKNNKTFIEGLRKKIKNIKKNNRIGKNNMQTTIEILN